ncbi:MAG TPA: alpha/beta hydrolase [Alphaproteobacteria bacterium]|nr:alpha/beta hydrolase [Alphaproteobacteria bacterium]
MPYLERQGARVFYERQGEGHPPLLFVHGFACSHDDWQPQVDVLRTRQCVVTCDLRGHGASSGEVAHCDIETYGADVSALVQTLDLPPTILVGHSLGCRVVLQAYLNAPQRAAGLVLVDGSRIGTGDPLAAEQAIRQHIHTIGYTTMMERFFAGMFLEGSDAAVKDRIVRRALALPEAIGAALFARLARWDAQYLDTAFQRVAVPLLVIQSTYLNPQQVRVPLQPGATTPWIELIRRTVPTAHIEIVGGAGHFTMLDKPAAVNQLLDAFVAHVGRSAA